tara:strand:+ start:263 stop:814 length:552 start_codon:yes stop_codon:yes gene_type:complete
MKKQTPKAKRLTEVKRKHLKTVKRRQLSEIKKSIRKYQRLNENFPIVFIGNGKVSNVLGNDAKSEENSASFQSIANGGAVILQVEYMWKGEGVLQLFVKVGDENKISYKHSDNVDESKVISFIEDVKPEIKRALENKIKQSDVKEYLGKIHIGSGYKDKIVDEDVAKVKAGIENFNTIKPSKV